MASFVGRPTLACGRLLSRIRLLLDTTTYYFFMPPLPPAPQVVEVKVNGLINTVPWTNVFHLQYTGTAPSSAQLDTLSSGVMNAWGTNFAPMVNTGVSVTSAVATDLTNALAAQGTATGSTAGSRAGTALSNAQSAVLTWKINMRYRGGHPRTYLPATVSSDITGGRLFTDTYVTALTSAAGTFRTALNALTSGATTYKMVCLRRTVNKQEQNPPLILTINSVLVDHRIDSQRDRMGKDLPA